MSPRNIYVFLSLCVVYVRMVLRVSHKFFDLSQFRSRIKLAGTAPEHITGQAGAPVIL
jgi:hypothetical protein